MMDNYTMIGKENKKKNAYMTLEATLLYPLIFGGILFTISLALYLYHGAVVKQIASVAALRGSLEQQMSQKGIKQLIDSEIDTLIDERLLLVSRIQKEVQVTESKVQVQLQIRVKLPFIGIPFMDFEWQELNFKSEAKRIRPVKIIRDIRRLYGS